MEFITVKPPCGRNIVILFQPPNSRKSKILTMDLADMCFVEYVGGEKFEKETPKCSMKLEEFRRRSLPKSHEAKKKTASGNSAHDLFWYDVKCDP